ncbi:single-stranded DNA-binding protein [Bartonella sp. DGB2]|uniref:single-stranded DNA-binding protein n=1 Tax=Bartonella sp. DGB2 TaxID=3388426 RepID=UPI00398FF5C1
MAGSLNKVMLIGNVGADPEIRRMGSGDSVANLRIATSETWRDRNTGERRDRTEWHSVVIFNENLVKVVEQYVKKGAKLYIEGQLQTRKWQDQTGADRYTTEIVLQKFRGELHMLDSRNAGGGEAYGRGGVDNRQNNDDRGHATAPFDSYNANQSVYNQSNGGKSNRGGDSSQDLNDEIPF